MRKLYFLLPGTDGKFACGGLWAELKTINLAKQICSAEVVTYRQREKGTLFLDDLLKEPTLDDSIFVINWGFDIPKLIAKLKFYNVVYHAHSAGYGFRLPGYVPIIAVSRNTMGYWGQKSPNSLIYYLPNQISDEFQNLGLERDIDILVQARKSSEYLMQSLVPALQKQYQVKVVNSYVEDLVTLFNRAKVYLYDSGDYWAQQGVSEGFGLQPMEALACGCQVFSSVNGGLSDYLDPGFNCYKIAGYSQDYDIKRIARVLDKSVYFSLNDQILSEYRTENITQRLQSILSDINDFFDNKNCYNTSIKDLTKMRLFTLKINIIIDKIRKKILKV
jgi:glycosyltransferase involved in cell wall biosynthesis